MGLLLNGGGDLVLDDIEKTQVINAFFALVLTYKVSQTFVPRDRVQEERSYQQWKRIYSSKDLFKKPEGLHPSTVRKMAAVIATIITLCLLTGCTEKVKDDGERQMVHPSSKRAKE